MKSYKVRPQQIEMPARGPTLKEMAATVKERKRAERKKIDWVRGLKKAARLTSRASRYLNRSLEKQAKQMPNDKDLNKELWG